MEQLTFHKKQYAKEKKSIKEYNEKYHAALQVQCIVQTISESVQEEVHAQISAVVSKCLTTVFGESAYEFQIAFDKKRGKTEARLIFLRDENEIDPLEASGLGVVDIASFALRLACILCSIPPLRRFVALDEPFKHLHVDLQPVAAELLLSLAEETNTQFILITHSDSLTVGKVVRLS